MRLLPHPRPSRQTVSGAGLLLLTAVLGIAQGCGSPPSDQTLTRIEGERVMDRLNRSNAGRTLVIDSRPAEAFTAGHIPAAVNLRLEDLARGRNAELDGYSVIVVYGQNPASATAVAMCKRLRTLGYRDVRLFEGGFDDWIRAGRPVARDN